MEFLWMILIGFLAGALAKFVMPGRDPGGIVITIVLGIGGALLAGWLGRQAGWYGPGDPGPGILAATIGAIGILAIYRLVARRDRPHAT